MSEKITYVAGQYFDKWQLILDGGPIRTATSYLFPVRWNNQSAMLKLATAAEEKRGAYLMSWWNGNGAARIFAQEGDALLMERAHKTPSLIAMSQQGQDDEASRLISQIADQLHQPRERSLPELVPLAVWFRDLEPAGRYYGGILAQAAAMAGELLRDPQDNTVLHGDLHHGNILYFGGRGWLAIDPKGLLGERGFDYANLFCNPTSVIALTPGRLRRQVRVVSEAARLSSARLLQWILAWSGLSAVWCLDDGEPAQLQLAVAQLAASELGLSV